MSGTVTRSIAMMKALPEMFPSPVALPKKLGHASEAVVHVLEPTENPNTYLQRRPVFSPVLIICDSNCMLAIGSTPVTTFPKENIDTDTTTFPHYFNLLLLQGSTTHHLQISPAYFTPPPASNDPSSDTLARSVPEITYTHPSIPP
ncbi:hypothetical protein MHYP_G00042720 [Metynnis hypsauchen]